MQGVKFPQQNTIFGKPAGWKDEDCYGLPVSATYYLNSKEEPVPCLISCWEITPAELAEVQRTGKIYLSITGIGMPPVSLSAVEPFGDDFNPQLALEEHNRLKSAQP